MVLFYENTKGEEMRISWDNIREINGTENYIVLKDNPRKKIPIKWAEIKLGDGKLSAEIMLKTPQKQNRRM